MLSVLSYNILFGKHVEEIVRWITVQKKQFDILCFQEFPKEKIRLVKKVLKPHSYAYASNVIYKGNDYGQLTVILNKKISLVDSTEIKLGTNVFEDKILRLRGERSSLFTKLRYNRKEIFLANTHLIAFAFNALRRKQLAMVVEHLENVSPKKKSLPTLVLGDLNYSSLFKREKLFTYMQKNGFTNAHRHTTHTLLFLKQQQLDYIFYKYCKVSNIRILKETFSDHFPMICTVSL